MAVSQGVSQLLCFAMHLCLILFLNLKQNRHPSSTFLKHNLLSRHYLIFQPISHLVDRLVQSTLHTANVKAFNCGWTQWEENSKCRQDVCLSHNCPMCLRTLYTQLHPVQSYCFVRKCIDTNMIILLLILFYCFYIFSLITC